MKPLSKCINCGSSKLGIEVNERKDAIAIVCLGKLCNNRVWMEERDIPNLDVYRWYLGDCDYTLLQPLYELWDSLSHPHSFKLKTRPKIHLRRTG
ncbi:hypothetical protein FKG94_00465 [Exilibacterium tricleocarpae]|uniref:Uncharacterized protein n=1 Tax=Exilibacterium tricleocarpae TaxID=2591008 RepID=A0A545U9B9_9GAMM|nr:hypothetical protein [Exilibacterium tricleocarpae]TQV86068.1 hypothetical protein FKG94_00465 [Exilibacterium tricleocarpae]